MANYKSLQMTPPTYPVSGPGQGGRAVKIERAEYTVVAAMPVADTIELFKLHPRFRVTGGYIKGNLGAAVTLDVGDAGDVDRYFALAVAATGTVVPMTVGTGFDYLNTGAFTTVFATIRGATTAATGSLIVVIEGIIEEPA